MKKLIAICIAALMAMVSTPVANAYSEILADMAKEMNREAGADGVTVTYDGKDIIMTFPTTFMSANEREALKTASAENLDSILKPAILSQWNDDFKMTFGTMLAMGNADLVVRLNLGDGIVRSVRITTDDIAGSME